MRKHYACGVAAIALASLAFGVSPSLASSHREAPGITKMPKVDATDLYMFRSYEPGRAAYVTFLANYQGLQGPGDGPNFFTLDPDAIYEIEIDNVGDGHEHLTYQFKMTNALANGTGIQLAVGGKTESIPLRAIPQVSGANANVGEIESYTLTQVTGDGVAAHAQPLPTPTAAAPPSPSRSTTSAIRRSRITPPTPINSSTRSTFLAARRRAGYLWGSARTPSP